MRLRGPDYPAPAKLNLFLHIVGQLPDGYHLLQSVFTPIDLCDRIRIEVRDDGRIERANDVPGVPADDDLAIRAARLLQEATGTRLGAAIEVEKRIPMGGGLGGGSSDAATVLVVLNRLWNAGFDEEALGEIGPSVYAAPELTRNTEPLKMEDFSAQPGHFPLHNDLEPVVTARYPEVREHLEWLRQHADARMTGSGGCVFAAFASRGAAQQVVDELPATMKGFVARGLEHHPLREVSSSP